tara:strand:- start:123 stop:539 length:417 start_codon:yes stop_codon:yes gene_type:complete
MKTKINEIVQNGEWEFAKLLKLSDICNDLAKDMYANLSSEEILELVWESQYDESNTIGMIVMSHTLQNLKSEFIDSFQKYFETATVQFKTPAKDDTPKNLIGNNQPPLPKPKAKKDKKPIKTVKGNDGIDTPEGVKRV